MWCGLLCSCFTYEFWYICIWMELLVFGEIIKKKWKMQDERLWIIIYLNLIKSSVDNIITIIINVAFSIGKINKINVIPVKGETFINLKNVGCGTLIYGRDLDNRVYHHYNINTLRLALDGFYQRNYNSTRWKSYSNTFETFIKVNV